MFMTGSKVFQFQKADNEVDGKHSEKSKHKLCGFFYHAFFSVSETVSGSASSASIRLKSHKTQSARLATEPHIPCDSRRVVCTCYIGLWEPFVAG